MATSALLFAAATAMAASYAVVLIARYRVRRSPSLLWWSISALCYVAAFAMEAATVTHGWRLGAYVIYLLAASGVVAAMSIGTAFLAWAMRVAVAYAVALSALWLGFAAALAGAPPRLSGSWIALNAGRGTLVGLPGVLFAAVNAVGGTVVVAGALWSFWRTRRWPNLLIGAGALVSSLGGTAALQGMGRAGLPIANMVGLALIFWGYLSARAARSPGAAAQPSGADKSAGPS